MKKAGNAGRGFEELVSIIARLRGPDGCPWDREQTVDTLVDYLLEEVYEAVDACQSGRAAAAREELGDVFLEVVFLCRLFEEKGEFDTAEALDGINAKMIARHPHVFGGRKVSGSREVTETWHRRKLEEKGRRSVLDGIAGGMPSLLEAFELGKKAAAVGFDWPDSKGVLLKVDEELAELREAVSFGSRKAAAEELGDLLFTAASAARHLGINPEVALRRANRKFGLRFRKVEAGLAERGRSAGCSENALMEELWNEAKRRKAPAPKRRCRS